MEFGNLLELIKTVSDSELTEFAYEENGVKIALQKEKTHVQVQEIKTIAPVANETAEKPSVKSSEDAGKTVTSPLVGTFYAAPAEDAEPFVKVGDTVKKGQVLSIVEAMKLMNEIESEFDGVIEEILVENGQAVEYGQPLFKIK